MIKSYLGKKPCISEEAFVAENATVVGDVEIKKDANIWYGAVLRGDIQRIVIGEGTNIQDNCTVHIGEEVPTIIGDNVTIGHNCVIHGCTIGSNTLVGMGAIILNGAEIGEDTIVGAGALITEGKKIPSGVLCIGSPAKVIRELTEDEKAALKKSADNYIKYSKGHMESK